MKQYIPHAVLAVFILVGAYLLITSNGAPTPVGEEIATTTSEGETAAPTTSGGSAPAPSGGGGISLPPGLQIVNQTAWATFTSPTWTLSFKYQQGWQVSKTVKEDGSLGQVSILAPELSILIQEDMPIAQPSIIDKTTTTETIAGQRVEVSTYEKPNEDYSFYIYFTLSDGNDDYHFSIRSKTDDKKDVNDFIERLVIN